MPASAGNDWVRLASSSIASLGRGEEDQDHQFLFDRVEAVRDTGLHKDYAARCDRTTFSGDDDRTPAARDVVDLVLGMRLLPIDPSGRQHIQPGAERIDAQEFEVGLSRPLALGEKL